MNKAELRRELVLIDIKNRNNWQGNQIVQDMFESGLRSFDRGSVDNIYSYLQQIEGEEFSPYSDERYNRARELNEELEAYETIVYDNVYYFIIEEPYANGLISLAWNAPTIKIIADHLNEGTAKNIEEQMRARVS